MKKKRKYNIFFFSTVNTSFVKEDLKILKKHFNVFVVIDHGISAILKIIGHALKTELFFVWFASVYSAIIVFISRLFNKKSVIVIGGVDVADYKEINYGIWLNWWKSLFVGYAIRNADKILAVDPFLMDEAKRLAKYDGSNLVYIPTGYDPEQWQAGTEKEKFVLSVGMCENKWRFIKKGFNDLIEVAKILPEVKFVVVGFTKNFLDQIKNILPKNLEALTSLRKEELLKYYQRAKVYCQLSFTEGLPNALCEAMLCECVPVGTNRGGIPTGIGDAGFIVNYGDIHATADSIRKALEDDGTLGKRARSHIVQNFLLSMRENKLIVLINQLSG